MRRQILLADDSITIQKVIELTFMDGEFDLTSVGSGDAALGKLDQGRPEAVIADIHMPGASGYDVCRAAKARYPDIPVVLLVGTFEPFEPADAVAVHADAVLKKPFDSQELLSTVRNLVAQWPAPAADGAPSGETPVATSPQGVDDDLELDSWEKLEIADEPAGELEVGPEPVWGNFDVASDASADFATERSSIGFALSEPSATLEPDSGFSTLAFSRSEFSLEVPAAEVPLSDEPIVEEPIAAAVTEARPATSWPAEPAIPAPTPISPVWNAPEIPSTPSWSMQSPEAAEPVVEEEMPIIELAPPAAATPGPAEAAPASVFAPAPPVSGVVSVSSEAAAVSVRLSDEDVERIARRVVELLGDHVVREVAWEVVPDLAELAIKDRLRELEAQIEN